MSRPGVTIAVAVVVDGPRVLVGRRSPDAPDQPGRDEFPGGLVEPGETPEQAAARECLEESGVAVVVGERLGRAVTESSRGATEILFFRCGVRAAVEPIGTFRWLPIADLPRCRFPTANRDVIDLLLGRAP